MLFGWRQLVRRRRPACRCTTRSVSWGPDDISWDNANHKKTKVVCRSLTGPIAIPGPFPKHCFITLCDNAGKNCTQYCTGWPNGGFIWPHGCLRTACPPQIPIGFDPWDDDTGLPNIFIDPNWYNPDDTVLDPADKDITITDEQWQCIVDNIEDWNCDRDYYLIGPNSNSVIGSAIRCCLKFNLDPPGFYAPGWDNELPCSAKE